MTSGLGTCGSAVAWAELSPGSIQSSDLGSGKHNEGLCYADSLICSFPIWNGGLVTAWATAVPDESKRSS